MRDRLFLLGSGFEDPAYPGKKFYCWHCALIEGVLAAHPELAERLDIERLDWPRPRKRLVDLFGVEHQSLPLLVSGGTLLADKDQILVALAERHGFPLPHP